MDLWILNFTLCIKNSIIIDNNYQLKMKEWVTMNERYRTFILLAQYKSFTETAKQMFCSQPTVSQHIQQLESELGCQLISRKKRQIELTTQGEMVLAYAQKMQEMDQQLRIAVKQTQQENIKLYISHYIADSFFDELFDKNNSTYKQYPYEINSYCYEDLKSSLVENHAKFAVMPIYDADKIVHESFDIDILFEEELVLVMTNDHPLASRQIIYTRDLKNLSMLLSQSSYLNQHIKQALHQKAVPVYYIQMTNFEIIKKAVQQGMGVSFLPYKSIEDSLDKLTFKYVKGLSIKRKNGIVFNRNQILNEQEQAFCERIKKKLKIESIR